MNLGTINNPDKVVEKKDAVIEPPSLYRILLLNDDFTPMEFVVEILLKFFAINEEKAVNIMLKIHNEGKAICGIYSRDIAETKVASIAKFVRENKHPLACVMEEDK